MKYKHLFIQLGLVIAFLFCFSERGTAQEAWSLEYCRDQAKANFISMEKGELWKETEHSALEVLSASQLPQLIVHAEAKYLSDVPNPALPFGSFAQLPKDQYQFYLSANQLIYQGSYIQKMKVLEGLKKDTELVKLELDWYRHQQQIDVLYFNALLLEQQKQAIGLSHNSLAERLQEMQVAVESGALEAFQMDYLLAEQLRLKQQKRTLVSQQEAILKSLSIYMNEPIDAVSRLNPAVVTLEVIEEVVERREIEVMESQQKLLMQQNKILESQRLPSIKAYGSTGYGQPGLNFLKPNFDFYYQVGAKVSWNVYDWKKTKNQRRLNELQMQRIGKNKQQFLENLSVSISQQQATILELEEQLKTDQKEIELRKGILLAESNRLKNGVIKGVDYVNALNEAQAVQVRFHQHQIQIIQAKYVLQYLLGQ